MNAMAAGRASPAHGKDQSQEFQSITGASKATATRDLQDLAEKNILMLTGGGRSTRFRSTCSPVTNGQQCAGFTKEIE